MSDLQGIKVAILTADGFEEEELTSPRDALIQQGAEVFIVSPKKGLVKGWKDGNWSIELPVDIPVEDTRWDHYDTLMIPGGVMSPDKMRTDKHCIEFAKNFMLSRKPIAAICHGPQLLIETGLLRGRLMTSFHSIRTDLINAGAIWADEKVISDQNLVTSRSPKDLPAFNKKIIEKFGEVIRQGP